MKASDIRSWFAPILAIWPPIRHCIINGWKDVTTMCREAAIPRVLAWGVFLLVCTYSFAIACMTATDFPLLSFPIWVVAICWCILQMWKMLSKIQSPIAKTDEIRLSPIQVTVWVTIVHWLVLWMAGAGTPPDYFTQMRQVETGVFHDWHPFLHTITLWLFAKLCPSPYFMAMVQQAIFGLLCGWLCATLQRYHYRRKLIIVLLLIMALSPVCLASLRIILKDTAFALATFAITICTIHLWHTRGRWLFSFTHAAGLLLLVVYASFVRHNGIFLTIPFCLLLLFLFRGWRNVLLAVLFVVLCFGGIFGYTQIRKTLTGPDKLIIENRPDRFFTESIGVPLTMMGAAFVTSPESVPQGTRDLFLAMAPLEEWQIHWDGNYNSMKFYLAHKEQDTGLPPGYTSPWRVLMSLGPKRFSSLFIETVLANPGASIFAFLNLTSLAWSPFSREDWIPGGESEHLGTPDLNFYVKLISRSPLGFLFKNPGFYVLLWIIVGGFAFLRHGFKALILSLPFVTYAYGTALMLTGWDFRFFFLFNLCIVPTILLCLTPRTLISSLPSASPTK